MTVNERIKQARKALGLTQIEFGGQVGISQGHLTSIESGKRNVTEKTILVICTTFGINEEWLRTGSGKMLCEADSVILSQLSREYHLDTFEQAMINSFLKMKPEHRKIFKVYTQKLLQELSNLDPDMELSVDLAPEQEVKLSVEAQARIDAQTEVYRHRLEENEKGKVRQSIFPLDAANSA